MVDERKVPEGYKVTEVGIIPDEWEVIDFNDCFELLPNNTFSRSELNYNCGDFKNIHYGDILIKFPAILDCSSMEIPFINTNHVIKNNRSLVKDGDIIFADTAEDETVGKAIEIFNSGSQKLVSGLHTIPCRPKVIFEPKWLGYYLNHSIYHDQLLPYITGTKVSAISKSSIKETKVVKPLPAEQKAIAEALSDTDNLILSIEKLIDKKEKIKQGAMQQLLTGKKRLPGFSGEWNEYKITDIAIVGRGRVISHREINNSIEKLYPVYSSQTSNEGIMGYIDSYDFEGDYITWTTDGVNAGKVFYRSGKFNCTNVCGTIKLKQFDHEFVSMALDNVTDKYVSKNLANPKLMNDVMKNIEIALPSIEEQKAIAQILSDMNAEIEVLEEKLEKYKTIKQGMMQELLTGRIRLI